MVYEHSGPLKRVGRDRRKENQGKTKDVKEQQALANARAEQERRIRQAEIKRSPEGQANIRLQREERKRQAREAKRQIGAGGQKKQKRKKNLKQKDLNTAQSVTSSPKKAVISSTVDEFHSLQNLTKQIRLNTGSFSKAQIRAVANMSDEQFDQYVQTLQFDSRDSETVVRKIFHEILDSEEEYRVLDPQLFPELEKRVAETKLTRENIIQDLSEKRRILVEKRANDPAYLKALELKKQKQAAIEARKAWMAEQDRLANAMTVGQRRVAEAHARVQQILQPNKVQKILSPRIGPANPGTLEAYEEQLPYFRSRVGFERGAKGIYQARVQAEIHMLETELRILDDSGIYFNYPGGGSNPAYLERVKQVYDRMSYLKSQLKSNITSRQINPLYDKHLRGIQIEEKKKAKDELAAEMERRRKPFQFSPDYMARYENLEPQQRAVATAARTEGRMTSSIADTIADDTMRAASVIHSSKLGFAAVGAGVIGAAFGIQSMRNRNEERRRNLR